MKITIMMEDGDETRFLVKDYGDAWDLDVYAACNLFRDTMNVWGFNYVDNVIIQSEDKEWSCRF